MTYLPLHKPHYKGVGIAAAQAWSTKRYCKILVCFLSATVGALLLYSAAKGVEWSRRVLLETTHLQRHKTQTVKPSTTPAPLCVIAAWERGGLPQYIRTSIETFGASSNSSFAKLYLFLPPTVSNSALYDLLGREKLPGNVHVVNIGDVDEAYRTTGWAGFVADRLCAVYGRKKEHRHCNVLRSAVRQSERPLLVSLRPMYGELFKDWVRPSECISWAWGDLDVLFGDLPALLNAPIFTRDADIYTVGANDHWRFYTHGQMTVFNQRNLTVNDVWRGCPELSSFGKAVEFFRGTGWSALDEGCTVHAAMSKGLRIISVPVQGADWGQVVMVRQDRGVLTRCEASRNDALVRERCRQEMRMLTDLTLATREMSPFAQQPTKKKTLELYQPLTNDARCSDWLPAHQQWCIRGAEWNSGTWFVETVKDGPVAQGLEFQMPVYLEARTSHGVEIRVVELGLFHMQRWKNHISIYKRDEGIGQTSAALKQGHAVLELYNTVAFDNGAKEADQDLIIMKIGKGS
ncbi:hypothetical protein HDU85_004638 [Gaertneriomyces sp. JEL0708]|nr:hypothetical protein HDU85_004638 [Gaertneriomyces sp. JEL0708]